MKNMNSLAGAMALAAGMIFRCDDRTLRLERVDDSGIVELRDLQTQGLLGVRDPISGSITPPTIAWMREKYAAGQLCAVNTSSETASQRQARFDLLDPDLCHDRDPRSTFRFRLAWDVLAAEIPRTDRDYDAWLDDHFGSDQNRGAFERPSASSLRRWVRTFEKREKKIGALVSHAGRPRGRSQLEPAVDHLTTEAAVLYWATPGMKQPQAEAWLDQKIDEFNLNLPEGRTEQLKKPSKETLRKRIERLRCFETVAKKHGKTFAQREFGGSGEPLVVDHLLEVVLMDATTLDQVIRFSDDWSLPACRVRITANMCALSHAIVGWAPYAGPNRAETSAEAILSCMYPKEYDAKTLADFPGLPNIFGKPAAILPDNEIALVGPSSLPGINQCGITVLLPPIGMPTAKAALERFFRTLKQLLEMMPGTIIDPKRRRNTDYDPVEGAVLSLPQLRKLVSQAVATHNVSPSKALDNRSPLQVWERSRRATPAFEDREHIRRLLGRTHIATLSRDGIELDGIRYRDAEKVRVLMDNMAHTAARRRERKDGSFTIQVKIRRHDGNLDLVEVHDTLTNEYVELPSTQPEYTHQLTAWEHKIFGQMAKRRREAFDSQNARLKSRARSLEMIDEMAPELAFQKRREMAALYQSTQVEKIMGAPLVAFPSDGLLVPQRTGEKVCEDGLPDDSDGAPSNPKKSRAKHRAPVRTHGYYKTTSEDLADDVDWNSVEVARADRETGVEPAAESDLDLSEDGE